MGRDSAAYKFVRRRNFIMAMRLPDRSAFRQSANFYLACASEPLALAYRTFERATRRNAPASPAEWRRVLLLGASHIGDVLYNTGSLPALAPRASKGRAFSSGTRCGSRRRVDQPASGGSDRSAGSGGPREFLRCRHLL